MIGEFPIAIVLSQNSRRKTTTILNGGNNQMDCFEATTLRTAIAGPSGAGFMEALASGTREGQRDAEGRQR